MESSDRTGMGLTMSVGFAVAAFCLVLIAWNRHDFCLGWADHYRARAANLRAASASSALGKEEVREQLIAADLADLVSRQFAALAWRPWRPIPNPLVTPEEQQIAARKR